MAMRFEYDHGFLCWECRFELVSPRCFCCKTAPSACKLACAWGSETESHCCMHCCSFTAGNQGSCCNRLVYLQSEAQRRVNEADWQRRFGMASLINLVLSHGSMSESSVDTGAPALAPVCKGPPRDASRAASGRRPLQTTFAAWAKASQSSVCSPEPDRTLPYNCASSACHFACHA